MSLVITKEMIKGMKAAEFMEAMSHPELKKQIDEVLADPRTIAEIRAAETAANVDPEVAAAQEALRVAEAEKAAEEAAEQAAAAAAAVAAEAAAAIAAQSPEETARLAELARLQVEKDALEAAIAAKPKKIIVEYQPEDENGHPIGRATHLEATSWEEMSKKQQECHVQAVRAMSRFKKQKDAQTYVKPQPVIPTLTDEEILQAQTDLQSGDPVKVERGKQKLQLDAVVKLQKEAQEAKNVAEGQRIAYEFMQSHILDYKSCTANGLLLNEYLQENNLAFTVNNLEVAFEELKDKLAPVEQKVPEPTTTSVPVVANPATVAPVTPPPVAPAAVVAPVVAPVVASNVPAPVVKPRVHGGIVPGSLGGGKPVTVTAKLTKADIKAWTKEQMRQEMQNPARVAEINAVLASR